MREVRPNGQNGLRDAEAKEQHVPHCSQPTASPCRGSDFINLVYFLAVPIPFSRVEFLHQGWQETFGLKVNTGYLELLIPFSAQVQLEG